MGIVDTAIFFAILGILACGWAALRRYSHDPIARWIGHAIVLGGVLFVLVYVNAFVVHVPSPFERLEKTDLPAQSPAPPKATLPKLEQPQVSPRLDDAAADHERSMNDFEDRRPTRRNDG